MHRLAKRGGGTVILTSASLVRKDDEGDIDKNLKVRTAKHFFWSFKLFIICNIYLYKYI